jgi:hypothetical protein
MQTIASNTTMGIDAKQTMSEIIKAPYVRIGGIMLAAAKAQAPAGCKSARYHQWA